MLGSGWQLSDERFDEEVLHPTLMNCRPGYELAATRELYVSVL